jgi:hypothetical protein
MNQGFKLRFDQMRESDPTSANASSGMTSESVYAQPSSARNLCFVWPDGRQLFLNYAYLIAGEFEPNSDKNLIRLNFSSHTVLLHGFSLDKLFTALLDQLPRQIVAVNPRYRLEEDVATSLVVEIIVEKQDV